MLEASALMAFVATTDGERARGFYRDLLGLRLVSEDPYALVFDANGTTLRVARVEARQPPPYTVLGWIVKDIRAMVQALTAKGVVFERFPGMGQDDLGVCTFPGGSHVAWFKDPDGNTLSLTESADLKA